MCLRNTHLSIIFSEPTVVAPTGFLSRLLTLSYIRATLSKLDRFQNLAEATLQLVTLQLPSYLILIWLQSLILFLTEEPQGRRKV